MWGRHHLSHYLVEWDCLAAGRSLNYKWEHFTIVCLSMLNLITDPIFSPVEVTLSRPWASGRTRGSLKCDYTCLARLTPQSAKRPSIVLTRASVEREETERSIGSRLPSHLSLGSSNFLPTPAPTSPLSLFLDEKHWPPNRSVTPVLFPEHQLQVPNIRKQSPACLITNKMIRWLVISFHHI